MIVDDRLDTVLQTQAAGRAGLNTQFRQLVDLLGRTTDQAWTDRHSQALGRLDSLHAALGDAAAAVLIGLCTLRSPTLIAHLVRRGPRTAIAAIGRARLDDAAWLRLIPALPVHARGALRHRRDLTAPVIALLERLGIDDYVLSAPEAEVMSNAPAVLVAMPTPAPPRVEAAPREGIGAIVQRIEAFRRNRQADDHPEPGQTRLPFAEDPAAEPLAMTVDVAIDTTGTIIATDGVDPALLVGHMPFAPVAAAAAASVDAQTLRAFGARLPIVAGRLVLDGAPRVAGAWRIDAAPRFDPAGGAFTGYRARLRRAAQVVPDDALVDRTGGDSLQQLLHELRTPINAIQGFAELIQQQMLGPTPHQYRSLAASIAADAARMLAGFEDVERLVRLESGRTQIDAGEADLAVIMARLATQLEPLVAPREIRLRWSVPDHPVPITIDPGEAERLLWRLLSTLTAAAAPGERLALTLDTGVLESGNGDLARVRMTLPAALARHDDDILFAPDIARGSSPGMGMLGHGFALRLAAAEVHAAGGQLVRPGSAGCAVLELTLPVHMPAVLDRTANAF